MPMVILALFGYLALFGAGLVGKYFTGWDTGYCMTGIIALVYILFFVVSYIDNLRKQPVPGQR